MNEMTRFYMPAEVGEGKPKTIRRTVASESAPTSYRDHDNEAKERRAGEGHEGKTATSAGKRS